MRQTLKNLGQAAPILLFIASMAGCSSSNIRSDYDRGTDFGAYKTYNFIDGAGPDYEGYQKRDCRAIRGNRNYSSTTMTRALMPSLVPSWPKRSSTICR